MIRIPAILLIAAVAASGTISSASAQAYSSGYGTGNAQATHYDGQGHLINDAASQNGAVTAESRGLSANAAAPLAKRAVHRHAQQ